MRAGLYIRGNKVQEEVRLSVIRFARWLRLQSDFPIRVPVYLSPAEQILTRKGERVSAAFFAPFDRAVDPYIRVAAGDYGALRAKHGRDNALASILGSVAHEIVHYRQWCQGRKTSEREAVSGASRLVRAYAQCVPHP